jgi:hypothetical protein
LWNIARPPALERCRAILATLAAQAVEHYEIARYGTLKSSAMQFGKNDAAQLLEQTLLEEAKTSGADATRGREGQRQGQAEGRKCSQAAPAAPAVVERLEPGMTIQRDNGLTIVLLLATAATLLGMLLTELSEYNNELEEHGGGTSSFGEYITTGHFLSALFVMHGQPAPPYSGHLLSAQMGFESFQNWQSEFLSTAVVRGSLDCPEVSRIARVQAGLGSPFGDGGVRTANV